MKEGDILVIGNGLDNRKPDEILKSYNLKAFDKFSKLPILSLGLAKEDIEFGVRFKNSRIESYYSIKNPKTVSFLGKTVNFQKGDQIISVISYKYDQNDLISFLRMYFNDVRVYVSPGKGYALALCKK
jgi:uncharacterized SAM-dependent methyltransferase